MDQVNTAAGQRLSRPVEGVTSGVMNVCLWELVPVSVNTSSTFWKLARPQNKAESLFLIDYVPHFYLQLASILLGVHILSLILRPLRLPHFSVEMLAGILVAEGLKKFHPEHTIPFHSIKVLDTIAPFGLIYYIFLVGLEIDISTVRHIEREALYTGLTGMVLPLLTGFFQFFVIAANPIYRNFFSSEFWEHLVPVRLTGSVFWGVALIVTSFPDLTRILSDIKLLHTDIGRLALSSSIVSELATWILYIIALALNHGTLDPLYLLPTFTFLVVAWFLRHKVTWALRHADETGNKLLLHFITFVGVMTSTIITIAFGTNSVVGAFVFGLIIPSGDVPATVIENLEHIVKGIFIPVYFMANGVKTNWRVFAMSVFNTPIYTIVLLVVMAWSAKLTSTFVFSKLAGRTTREAFTLGVLMNTKGILALLISNNGRNNLGFNQQMFVVLTLSLLMMSVTVMPLAKAASKSNNRKPNRFKHKTMESDKLESELRILTCIHSTRNLSGMINLLECSNANKQYPISVFAVHLVQLTDRRVTAMLIIHDDNKNIDNNLQHVFEGSGQNLSRRDEESKHNIITTFESLESRGDSVSAQTLTVVSPYATMHEDISCVGEDKRVMLILIPFHKQADVYGRLQDENLSWRTVNKNLMAATTSCSVGILVDRGLGSKDKTIQPQSSFVVIFVGGPDDREALTFAWRMAKSPNVNLTVLRLIPTNDVDHHDDRDDGNQKEGSVEGLETMSKRHEKELDDEYINEFRFRTMHDESINYIEKGVKTEEEVIRVIGRVVPSCDLYILGQSKNVTHSIMLGLSEWMEYDELGVLGDTLLTSEFAQDSSLLIIKQHYVPRTGMWIRHSEDSRVLLGNSPNTRSPSSC